jgi:hypothetical protein
MEACGEESSCCSYSLVEDINHNTMLMEVEQMEEKEASSVLPQEIWLLIFGNLGEKDLYTVAQVRGGMRAAMSSLRRSGTSSWQPQREGPLHCSAGKRRDEGSYVLPQEVWHLILATSARRTFTL